jgi:hypothetical protein
LKDKREQQPEATPIMTEDEMQAAEKALDATEKAVCEASKWLFNLQSKPLRG